MDRVRSGPSGPGDEMTTSAAAATLPFEFVVKPVPSCGGPREFRQSMRPHPMVHHELPYEPVFGIYNGRLRALEYGKVSSDDLYWQLRRQVTLVHTGEMATEIAGPHAERLLNRVFTRDVSKVRVGRCSYQIACLPDGGMIMDGVLLRLAADRFWYAQGDGEFPLWLHAHAIGLDVAVRPADVWISQVQGPRALDVLAQVADDGLPEPFRYFDLAEIRIAGQPVVISRTGYTNELGWEFYFGADVDADAIGEKMLQAGRPHGMHPIPGAVTNARRIEAGLLFSGTDFDFSVTPFAAGLGAMVDLQKTGDFIGKAALAKADQRRRSWGLQCAGGVPRQGETLFLSGQGIGRVCSTAWSPFLQCGIAIVRMNDAAHRPGTVLQVETSDGKRHDGTLCELPMYDQAGDIQRGRCTDIPEIPDQPRRPNAR
ncbi:aminomethyltransferase family protein [Piscinibacter sakaiensis]|uniref:aminomethyltransferase family protein n=1 Tax=Piscinibacter sakaiensis TaxID=1547922 RepID=UPI003AB0CB63